MSQKGILRQRQLQHLRAVVGRLYFIPNLSASLPAPFLSYTSPPLTPSLPSHLESGD